MRLVAHLQLALTAHAHDAQQRLVVKDAEHRAIVLRRDPRLDIFQCQRVFLFVT
ncbi:hypothetical protein D3C77_749660 [compost metagenome]